MRIEWPQPKRINMSDSLVLLIKIILVVLAMVFAYCIRQNCNSAGRDPFE